MIHVEIIVVEIHLSSRYAGLPKEQRMGCDAEGNAGMEDSRRIACFSLFVLEVSILVSI